MKALRLVPIALALLVAGCTTDELLLQRRVDYRSGSDNLSKNPLEVPPDLTSPSNNPAFNMPNRAVLATASSPVASQVLPDNAKAKLVSAGGQRWLVVHGKPEKLWGEIREFWIANGFILTVDNAASGIMETDWLENRAKLPQDTLTRMLNKISSRFASTGELDKFRTRLERGSEPDTTEIFISHQGMTEAYRNDGSTQTRNQDAVADTIWVPRPNDPELEAEMDALLLQHFGMDQQTAQGITKAPVEELTKADLVTLPSGGKAINIVDSYDRAWRRTGLALERIGFVISDRDRTQGTYYVRRAETDIGKEENTSFMSKLAFWRKSEAQKKVEAQQQEYIVQLKQQTNQTVLTLQPKGKADAALEQQLMDGLLKQLK
ncbi:MAG: outer membrane protein assembly factor BamC [Formivibrio sp.]|nr:outer membrane protein assembly factor BamC [Formivibrio sp.]